MVMMVGIATEVAFWCFEGLSHSESIYTIKKVI